MILYRIFGKIHRLDRDADGRTLPSVITKNGIKFWYRCGKLHRDELDKFSLTLPAIEHYDGSMFWYQNNEMYREDFDAHGHPLHFAINSTGPIWWQGLADRPSDGFVPPAEFCLNINSHIIYYENNQDITMSVKPYCAC